MLKTLRTILFSLHRWLKICGAFLFLVATLFSVGRCPKFGKRSVNVYRTLTEFVNHVLFFASLLFSEAHLLFSLQRCFPVSWAAYMASDVPRRASNRRRASRDAVGEIGDGAALRFWQTAAESSRNHGSGPLGIGACCVPHRPQI
jgi:hypothetical protein